MAKQSDKHDVGPQLYLFSPVIEDSAAFAHALEAALDAGDVACLLLRVAGIDPGSAKKIIQTIAPIAQDRGAALLVDGDPRLVARSGADGVHLRVSGEKLEETISDAIASLKPDHIVGAGGLRTRHDAMSSGEHDIDYVMFGEPSHDGWTPPIGELVEKVSWWSEIFNVPCVAFASRVEDVAPLVRAGADFVALGDAIWSDPRGPASAMRDASAALRSRARTS